MKPAAPPFGPARDADAREVLGDWLEAQGADAAPLRPGGWAAACGLDERGVWAGFELDGVEQRLRWIVPGCFVMGSPADELGRASYEGPQHEVTLSAGFWIAQTACTQGLWRVVTGDAPSYFEGDERPVESVSWDEVQLFLARLDARVPGLGARLPTSAQWEYACRAGSTRARPCADDAIARHVRGGIYGTWLVASHRANAWGLFDMIGNVLEWCADQDRIYADGEGDGAIEDPVGAVGHARVIRGGGWCSELEQLRSAARYLAEPHHRRYDLGFRLLAMPR